MIRCPACESWVDEKGQPGSGPWRCNSCGVRFAPPKRLSTAAAEPGFVDEDGLGIHPALARKYKKAGVGEDELSGPSAKGGETSQKNRLGGPGADAADPDLDPAFEAPGHGDAGLGAGGLDEKTSPRNEPTIQLSPSLVDEGAGETDEPVPPLRTRDGKTRPISGSGEDAALSSSQPTGPRRMAASPAQAPRPPDAPAGLPVIPGYAFEAVVGKGAMGSVFLAKRTSTGEAVAVKILAKELAARPDFIARFEREAAALKAVDHPGVVSILDRGAHDDHHYLAMPFVDGISLRRVLAKGALMPIRALGFSRQIAQALGAAHDKKVIHRDLKPENILVVGAAEVTPPSAGMEEKLILVDFGLAGMGEDDPHPNLTKSRMTMGTVNYMAPEQRTDAKRVGPQADVYAAGVILYELLTGDLPLGRFKMPTARPGLAHLPKLVDECVGRALDRDPEQRYVSCREMDADLAAIETELEKQASRDTVVGRVAKTIGPIEGMPDHDDAISPFDQKAEGAKRPGVAPGGGAGERVEHADTTPDGGIVNKAALDSGLGGSGVGGMRLDESGEDTAPSGDPHDAASGHPHSSAALEGWSETPDWVTAPPWVKRPLMVWGTLALLVGGAIGVWYAPASDDAPNDLALPKLEALGASWVEHSPGWDGSGDALQWIRRAAGSQGQPPNTTDQGPAAGRVIWEGQPDRARPWARARILLPPPSADGAGAAWGGVAFALREGTVGVAVANDGTCVRHSSKDLVEAGATPVSSTPLACTIPASGPIEVALGCDLAPKGATDGPVTAPCTVRFGTGEPVVAHEVTLWPDETPKLGLYCGGSRCTFRHVEAK